MGRAFEKRRARKEARWGKVAKAFTRLGKEIVIAVKEGGPNPDTNARLRVAVQNAKSINMPKDRIDAAIKRASSKDESDYQEIVYEGYGPYGVAVLIECATDNPTRTVASIRLYFSKGQGSLGKTGSLDFIFDRKGVFRISKQNINIDDLELELIDFGLESITEEEDGIYIYTDFSNYGTMQKAIEDKGLEVLTSELQRIPSSYSELTEEQEEEIHVMLDKMEDDDDVQAVYHNIK